MGMACDADARGTVAHPNLSPSPTTSVASAASVAPSAGAKLPPAAVSAEETALILASLSKGQFGAAEDSDNDNDDMEDISGDDDNDDDDDDGNGDGSGQHRNGTGASRVQRVQQINFDGPVGSKLDFLDDAGLSHRFRNESNRVKSLVTKHISIDELRAHFDRPIIDVAKDFGICITLMKKICRRNGIKRWPHRQIRSLSKSIASMEAAMLSAHGSERDKYRDQISSLQLKRESVIADPNKENAMRPKTPTKDNAGSGYVGGGLSVRTPPAVSLGLKLPPNTSHLALLHVAAVSSANSGVGSAVAIKAEPMATTYAPGAAVTTATGTSNSHQTSGGGASLGTGSHAKGGRWTTEEHAAFLEGIRLYGKDWRRVAQVVASRSAVQTRTHAQKYLLKFAGRFPFDAAATATAAAAPVPNVNAVALNRPPGSSKVPPSVALAATRRHEADDDVAMESAGGDDATNNATPTTSATASDRSSSNVYFNDDAVPSTASTASRVAIEAMAMILNSPESPMSSQTTASLSSAATSPTPLLLLPTAAAGVTTTTALPTNTQRSLQDEDNNSTQDSDSRSREAFMYSPMSATSSIGRALPSLAIPSIKSESESSKQYDSPVGNDNGDDASTAMAP